MDKKKKAELDCYETMLEYINTRANNKTRKYFYSIFPHDVEIIQSERPDFIINAVNNSYLIEHFLIDYCYDGPSNDQSRSKLASREVNGIYNKYHDSEIGTIKDCDMGNAVNDLQTTMNKIVNISSSFDHNKYVENFTKNFQNHYGKIPEYRKNTLIQSSNVKIGFLIEFHCDTAFVRAKLNGSKVSFYRSPQAPFPITMPVAEMFEKAKDLDFVILAEYQEGVPTKAKSVRIFEPGNMEKSLEIQRIRVYDEAYYEKCNSKIILNLEKDN